MRPIRVLQWEEIKTKNLGATHLFVGLWYHIRALVLSLQLLWGHWVCLHSSHSVQYIICVYLSWAFLYIVPWSTAITEKYDLIWFSCPILHRLLYLGVNLIRRSRVWVVWKLKQLQLCLFLKCQHFWFSEFNTKNH